MKFTCEQQGRRAWIILALLVCVVVSLPAFGQTGGEDCARRFVPPRPITSDQVQASSVFPADLDGDGDVDVVAALPASMDVVWYENTRSGRFNPERVIVTDDDVFLRVYAADLDGDGDMDVLAAARSQDRIEWYENTDGLGTFGPPRIITHDAHETRDLLAVDLDGDGDLDVLSAADDGQDFAWYENTDSLGTFGPKQGVGANLGLAVSIFAADLNGDTNLDVLSATRRDPILRWHENLGGTGAFGALRSIPIPALWAMDVESTDIDGDGDNDVVATVYRYLDEPTDIALWFENTDGAGTFGPPRVISSGTEQAEGVAHADLDADGDVDIVTASVGDDQAVGWYENLDGMGTFSSRHTFGESKAAWAYVADFNGDGQLDILCGTTLGPSLSIAELDCNGNGTNDGCDIAAGTSVDCNGNGRPDECDLADGASPDCNGNDVPDECDIAEGTAPDCNLNGVPDGCDLVDGLESDCDGNGVPDSCEPGCNDNGRPDVCDIADGVSADCNANGVPDECDIQDIDHFDCNTNGVPDACDITSGVSPDCNANGIPDECDIVPTFAARVIDSAGRNRWTLRTVDLDRDGDIDVLTATVQDGTVDWYENVDGLGQFGPARLVAAVPTPLSAIAADLDGDSDLDIIAATAGGFQVVWYENLNGRGSFGPPRVVDDASGGSGFLMAADIDGDSDVDLVSLREYDGSVAWYKNVDGLGTFGAAHILDDSLSDTLYGFVLDVDADGDNDVVVADGRTHLASAGVYWYENVHSDGLTFVRHTIAPVWSGVVSVVPADVDGDGFVDIVGASVAFGGVRWSRNIDGLGHFGALLPVSSESVAAESVAVADVDGDGDLDVIGILGVDGIGWFANAGNGQFGRQRTITTTTLNLGLLGTADLNQDGYSDFVTVSTYGASDVRAYFNNDATTNCNNNFVPDECELAAGTSFDCNGNHVIDTCETDCNHNGRADECDIADGTSADDDGDGIPDECDAYVPVPTVSEWGMVTLALLLLVAAKLHFGYRSAKLLR